MNKNALEVKDLSIFLGGHQVLDDVSFEVQKGSLTYIVGANGSGKTTLVRAILGLTEPQEGSIYIFGKPRTQELVAKHIGYVPQYTKIDRTFPISVEEMIQLDCDNETKCAIGVEGHLRIFDSEHLEKRKISNLSGGEFQKVLIARALVNDPDILILDEPVNNLDHESQHNLLQKLRQINEESGKTILIISHDHHVIDKDGDNIIYVADHKVTTGPASKVLVHIKKSNGSI